MSVHSVHLSSSHDFSKQSQPSITLVRDHGVEGDVHAGKTVKHLHNMKKHAREQAKAQREDPTAIIPVPLNQKQVHLIQGELFEDDGFGDNGQGPKFKAGDLGENITAIGLDLVGMSKGTRLTFVDLTHIEARYETRDGLFLHANAISGDLACSAALKTGAMNQHQDSSSTLLRLLLTCATFLAIRHYPDLQTTRNRFVINDDSKSHFTYPSIVLTGLRNPCSRINDFKSGLMAHCYVKDESGKTIGVKVGVMAIVERGGIVAAGMRIVIDEPDVFVQMERI